ncbi:TPA: hypothetical protein ACP31A_003218 [Pseudomonas aeruginosa]|nr:hypothetical protein [Pseudomonas aeruginosa]HCT4984291.1 hypothetical protein [Pseudomonas aeruginosa]
MNSESLAQRSIDHAWRYFELHAQQRMTVFNFYLAISGIVSAGIGACLQGGAKMTILASILGGFLSLVSFLFWKLDQRVSEMIKRAESALRVVENDYALPVAALFNRDSKASSAKGLFSVWTYGRCFRVAFLTVGIVGIILTLLPAWLAAVS